MRFLRRSLTGLFLASLSIAALVMAGWIVKGAVDAKMAQTGGAMPQRERVYTANVVSISPETVQPVLEAFGEVISRRTLEIRSRTAGTIVDLADSFVDGGRVEAGQVLVSIDPTDLQDTVALARATVAEAEAEVSDADAALILERDDLANAERQVELRQAALDRQQGLVDRGIGTASDLETAALAAGSAAQSVLSGRSSVNAAAARVASAKIALDRAKIALAEAERRLGEATITAAFTGSLADVSALEGRLVTANEQIATLVDPDALEVSFRLSTAQYARLLDDAGQLVPAEVTVSLDVSGIDLVATGRIARESAAVGAGQTGRLIFAALDSARGFRPGDFVTVAVSEPELEGVARLPASAVSSTSTVLFLGEEDRLTEEPVEIVRRQGEIVLIRAGANAGREVVAERAPTLGSGIRIRPVRQSTEGTPQIAEAEPVEMVTLEEERREKLIAFVEGSATFPQRAKERILTQLRQPEVPQRMVDRIERRMGS